MSNMSLFATLFLLSCLTPFIKGDCLDLKKLDEIIEEDKKKSIAPIIEECQKENPAFDEKQLNNCHHKKHHAAYMECRNKSEDHKVVNDCVNTKLNIESPYTAAKLRNQVIQSIADESKRKEIEGVLDACLSKDNVDDECIPRSLIKGPCPELKQLFGEE